MKIYTFPKKFLLALCFLVTGVIVTESCFSVFAQTSRKWTPTIDPARLPRFNLPPPLSKINIPINTCRDEVDDYYQSDPPPSSLGNYLVENHCLIDIPDGSTIKKITLFRRDIEPEVIDVSQSYGYVVLNILTKPEDSSNSIREVERCRTNLLLNQPSQTIGCNDVQPKSEKNAFYLDIFTSVSKQNPNNERFEGAYRRHRIPLILMTTVEYLQPEEITN